MRIRSSRIVFGTPKYRNPESLAKSKVCQFARKFAQKFKYFKYMGGKKSNSNIKNPNSNKSNSNSTVSIDMTSAFDTIKRESD